MWHDIDYIIYHVPIGLKKYLCNLHHELNTLQDVKGPWTFLLTAGFVTCDGDTEQMNSVMEGFLFYLSES